MVKSRVCITTYHHIHELVEAQVRNKYENTEMNCSDIGLVVISVLFRDNTTDRQAECSGSGTCLCGDCVCDKDGVSSDKGCSEVPGVIWGGGGVLNDTGRPAGESGVLIYGETVCLKVRKVMAGEYRGTKQGSC